MNIQLQNRPIIKDLGDGLMLCRSREEDAGALADFNSRIHSDEGFEKPDLRMASWTRDLLTRPHPTFHADDFTLVIEHDSGKIVSSMNLISQTWAYEDIRFGVGRPELVGTLPEYRKRGLVRAQFEVVHRWSSERGEMMQGITGIPFYYKLFGYEMGMELGGGRIGYEPQLPKLKEGESEPFVLRQAGESDIPFLMMVSDHACKRRLMSCVRKDENWRYELTGQSEMNATRWETRIIERSGPKEAVGYLTHPWYDWDAGLVAYQYELKPGVSWLDVTPSVARYLWKMGADYAVRDGKPEKCTAYGFWFGSEHPSYDIFNSRLPRVRDPYAWYVRVPDLPSFLRHLKPVLERRIVDSAIIGYNGEAKISFYRSGLRLVLENGRLTTIEPWMPDPGNTGGAAFPDLTFLQLLFGYRCLEELEQSYADCWYNNDEIRVLLNTLFPKKASSVMMVN